MDIREHGQDHHTHNKVVKLYNQIKSYGVHSATSMKAGGFQYTGVGDNAVCSACGLEVSGWTREMDPSFVHLERCPQCPFVRSMPSKHKLTSIDRDHSAKRQKIETSSDLSNQQREFTETDILKQVRQRTFSHWPKETELSKERMIKAGFFQCTVGDRTICLYCNLICQQWEGSTDDPVQVHKTLQPQCPYVVYILAKAQVLSNSVANEISPAIDGGQADLLFDYIDRLGFNQPVHPSPYHTNLIDISSRQATFQAWTDESAPSVEDLVKAGFFYTGVKNIVRCFCCNGSLQSWDENDNPLIEHIKWFPHCEYAKRTGGIELYQRVRQEHAKSKLLVKPTHNSLVSNHQLFQTNNENVLTRLVAARVDLPISQRLLDQNFSLSIVQRCWKDQLQFKKDDFATDCDLFIACMILQKQIEYISGNKENIIVPSIKMKLIQEQSHSSIDNSSELQLVSSSSNQPLTEVKDTSLQASSVEVSRTTEATSEVVKSEDQAAETKIKISNPCVLCWKEEKHLACIPCGHFTVCSRCGQNMHTCPICRRRIEAFVRIYI